MYKQNKYTKLQMRTISIGRFQVFIVVSVIGLLKPFNNARQKKASLRGDSLCHRLNPFTLYYLWNTVAVEKREQDKKVGDIFEELDFAAVWFFANVITVMANKEGK